jgi:hypothetical protein
MVCNLLHTQSINLNGVKIVSTSAIVGPGLLIGVFALIILTGFTLSLIEKRLAPTREH